jgi:hypothetical protein
VWRQAPPSLSARPAALLGFSNCPSQVYSRGWVSDPFLEARAHVSVRTPRFRAPIDFRRGDSIAEAMSPGKRGVRLLGFDSHLRSASPSFSSRKIDPALGFASCRVCRTPCCALERARPRSCHRPPESHGPQVVCSRVAQFQSAHGIRGDCSPRSLQRIDGADAWISLTASSAACS